MQSKNQTLTTNFCSDLVAGPIDVWRVGPREALHEVIGILISDMWILGSKNNGSREKVQLGQGSGRVPNPTIWQTLPFQGPTNLDFADEL